MSADQSTACDWDIVIAGGGLAGLAMACELSQPRFAHLKIAVVEPRTDYVRDRTWSYWRKRPHAFVHLERRRWHTWSLRHGGVEIDCHSKTPYCTIDSDAFYEHAVAQIKTAPQLHLLLQTSVVGIKPGWPALVELQSGRVLRAGLAIDARGHKSQQSATLAQHFSGWEVRTKNAVFDDQRVRLMDFAPFAQGLHFFYVLPYNARCALVESTCVSSPDHPIDHVREIKNYLCENFDLADYEITYKETASLDLICQPPKAPGQGVVNIGRAAGALRASTGYAFLDTVHHCAELANQIARFNASMRLSRPPKTWTTFKRPRLEAWMDKIFLQTLMANWHRGPDYFLSMFSQNASQTVISFLLGKSTFANKVKIASSLPPADFLKAAIKSFFDFRRN